MTYQTFKNKMVKVWIKTEAKNFCYRGVLIEATENELLLKDILKGRVILPRSSVLSCSLIEDSPDEQIGVAARVGDTMVNRIKENLTKDVPFLKQSTVQTIGKNLTEQKPFVARKVEKK